MNRCGCHLDQVFICVLGRVYWSTLLLPLAHMVRATMLDAHSLVRQHGYRVRAFISFVAIVPSERSGSDALRLELVLLSVVR